MIRRSAILALFASAVLIGPALGQDASSPAADQPPPAADVPPTPIGPAPPPVQAQPLQTLDLFSTGRDTGLGPDFWKGSSAVLAREVIPTLADRKLSPASAALARRVLANAATAPGDAGGDTALAAARVRALLALGDAADAGAILDRTPGLPSDAGLSQVAAEAALITDQPDKACQIGEALSAGRDGLYWLRLRAYCQARAGKTAQAQLTLAIASQAGAEADYTRLMGALLDPHADAGQASLRDGVDYALSHQLQLDLKPAMASATLAIAEHVRALPPAPPAPGVAPMPPLPPSEAGVLAVLHAATSGRDYLAAAKDQDETIKALVDAKTPFSQPIQMATAALYAGDLASAQTIRMVLGQDTPAGTNKTDLAILDASLAVASGKPDTKAFEQLVDLGVSPGEGGEKTRAQAAAALYAADLGAPEPGARATLAGFVSLGHGAASDGQLLALDLAAEAPARGDVAMMSLKIAETGGADGPVVADRVWLERALARAGLAVGARGFALEGLLGLQTR